MLGRRALPVLLAGFGLLAACAISVDTNAPIVSEDGGVIAGAGGDGAVGGGDSGSAGDSGSGGDGGWGGVIGGPPLGGAAGGGGDVGSSGNSGTGSGGASCSETQKLCNGMCVENGPTVGCTLDTCEPCPALWNAKSGCANGACTITCNSGYVKEGELCVAPGSGGAGGSGGSSGGAGGAGGAGGSTGSCVASSCPGCSVIGPFPCCNSARRCGCTWVPGGYCL